jgi:serine/threonine-protein kinase
LSRPLERIAEQYEIVAKIQEGGMGEIYKVRHRLLDELRVVKVLRPQLAGDESSSVRFAREARAAIQLRHPNVVQIFDFTLDAAGVGLMVMEYIRGADLKQLIVGGVRPEVPLGLEIARQGLQALGYLHRHGFVHRDVSPDNLMLTRDVEGRPLVKLIDLGIAKRLDSGGELTATGMFLGKYRYASPEHFGAGTAGMDARSDLYTFALVLYELLTGRFPLPGETTTHFVASHLYRQPFEFAESDPGGRVPEALRRALLKALAKEPGERFADAGEMIAEIEVARKRHPLDQASLEQAAEIAASASGETHWGPPGSTGGRLNREFARPASEAPPPDAASSEAPPPEAPAPADAAADRDAAVAEVVREVEALLDRGALMEADRLLFQATERLGEDGLGGVRQRLDELYHRELAGKVRGLLGEAESLAEAGRTGAALEAVRKAQAMAPEDLELARELAERAHEVRARIGTAERRGKEARRTAARVRDLVRDAGIAFEAGGFAEAADRLREALALTPDDPWLRDRLAAAEAGRQRLEQQEERRREARSLLGQAAEAESCRDVLKARLLVTRALELDPDDTEALELAKALDRRPIEPALTPEVAAVLREVCGLRRGGERLAAWRRLQAAIEELGADEALEALRREIADELLAGSGEQAGSGNRY